MLNGLVGKKLGMTSVFDDNGNKIGVTAVLINTGVVVRKKNKLKDGVDSIVLAFEPVESKGKIEKLSKTLKGEFKDDIPPSKFLKEFKSDKIDEIERGQKFDSTIFDSVPMVDVTGTSKGRGFAGVFKRHNFRGGMDSHGHRFHRTTGAIGNRSTPGRVFKNKKMPGHYGNEQVTVRGLKLVKILPEENVILIKGALPGPTGRMLEVRKTNKMFRQTSQK